MSWNKTSIASTATLNQIAKKFSATNSVTGSHHLRAKTDGKGNTIIYQKHFSATKFLAVMGNENAKEKIRGQRELARQLLSDKVDERYDFTSEDIQLRNHAPLRGYQVQPMLAHAAVAAAVKQMGFDQAPLEPEVKEALIQQTRDFVYSKGLDKSAEDRIHQAKLHLIQITVELLLPANFKNKAVVGKLCDDFWAAPHLRDKPDVLVAQVMLRLLRTNPEATIHNLNNAVYNARRAQSQQSQAE